MLTLHSDLDPDPKLYLEAARFSMMLLDPDSAERFAAAAAACGAPDAAPMRAMTLVLLGRGSRPKKPCGPSVARTVRTAIDGRPSGRPT
ncbi:hypothetical protein I552_4207 [Mycobacterium xenopi 3993]|nr:hypothetical protein I552_4207 [Mycobacterium xenopi 3993]